MQNNIVTSICNDALAEAGNSSTINSLADNTQLAELCNRFWEPAIDEAYADFSWAFRKQRAQANLMSCTPTHNEYNIPDNSLRLLGFYCDAGYQVKDESAKVRSKPDGSSVIFSNNIPLFVEFLATTSEQDNLPPLVRKCLTYLLAAKIAVAQGKDDQKILQKYTFWLDRAEENDSSEDSATHTYDDKFIDCR